MLALPDALNRGGLYWDSRSGAASGTPIAVWGNVTTHKMWG
jgi:hypothetical protein